MRVREYGTLAILELRETHTTKQTSKQTSAPTRNITGDEGAMHLRVYGRKSVSGLGGGEST